MRKSTRMILAALAPFWATSALAAEEKIQLGAHVHGQGKLNIIIEGQTMAMELEIPAWDIVGFGHEPSTDDQKEVMKAAIESLHDKPLSLFVLPKEADCKLASSKVDHEHADEHHEEGHKEHKEPEKHEGEHKEHKGEEKDAEHTEFHAKYKILCKSPEKLTSIKFAFFKRFANSKELDVTIIGKKGAKKYEVTQQKPVIEGLE